MGDTHGGVRPVDVLSTGAGGAERVDAKIRFRDIDLDVVVDFRQDIENPYRIFERLTATISTNLDFYGCLLTMRDNVSLVSKISEMLKSKTMETLLQHVPMDANVADIMLEYVISGMVAVYQQWFSAGRREPIEKLSETLSVLAFSGISGIMAGGKEGA